MAIRRQAPRRMRDLRGVRAPGGGELHLPRPLRAPAPGPGVGGDRHHGRDDAPCREGHGLGVGRLQSGAAPAAAGSERHRPRPLLDGGLVDPAQRPAHPRDLRARAHRARPQREPRQRRSAPDGPRGHRRRLPVDVRLRGDPPPDRPRGSPEPRAGARPGPGAGRRRILARDADPRHPRRLP